MASAIYPAAIASWRRYGLPFDNTACNSFFPPIWPRAIVPNLRYNSHFTSYSRLSQENHLMAYIRCGRNLLQQIVQESSIRKADGIVHPLLFAGQGVRYRKLEVILTTKMDKLGQAGEVVKVAPGYFRNYLMPKLLAVPKIDKFAYLVREQMKIYQAEEEEEEIVEETREDKMKEYIAAARRLDNAKLVLRRYYKVDNELREPVTRDVLVNEVARQLNVRISPDNLYLPNPLASFGEYEVPLRLPKSIPLPEGKIMWALQVKIRRK